MIKSFIKNNQDLVKESGFYLLGRLVPGLILFLSIPLFIRFFGESVYGEYALIMSAIMLVNTLMTGWINQSYMRFYSEKEDPTAFHGRMLKLLFLSLIAVLGIGDILLIVNGFPFIQILLFDMILINLSVFSFLLSAGRTRFMARKVVLADMIRAFVLLGSVVLMYYVYESISISSLIVLLIANVLAYFSGLIASDSIIANARLLLKSAGDSIMRGQELKQILQYGLPLAVWLIAANLLNISDRYVIKYFLDFKAVGEYAAIYDTFSKLMTFTFGPVLLALQPRVVQQYNKGDHNGALSLLRQILLIELSVFILMLIPVAFFRSYIVHDFLGLNNINLEQLVIPVFLGAFLWTIGVLIQKPLELKKRTKSMMYAVLIAFLINFAGNIIFIPKFGILAAAYTTVAGSVIYLIVMIYYQIKYKI